MTSSTAVTDTSWPPGPSSPAPTKISSTAEERSRINLFWLLRLRWGAAAGQIGTIVVVMVAELMAVPVLSLAAIIGIELLSNVAGHVWARRTPRVREGTLGLIMVFDVLLLTALLYLTGGPFNPFCFLYLVHIALAAVILRARWTWALALLSVACLGALFIGDAWLEGEMDHATHMERMHMHIEGMWVAMVVAAVFIVYFVTRVTAALNDRELELARARDRTARQEKLASLASLSAGAAHELSTPLSTIAVAAKELQRRLEQDGADAETIEDAQLIREQVARCRSILDHMAADAGQSSGESSVDRSVHDLVAESVDGLPEPERVRIEVGDDAKGRSVHVPPRSTSQALRVVLKNALDASPPGAAIVIRASSRSGHLELEVQDEGTGMSSEVLARVGEPFFSTKGPGSGMGLGLFLSRAVVERIGGSLHIASELGKGTTVKVTLPTTRPISAVPLATLAAV